MTDPTALSPHEEPAVTYALAAAFNTRVPARARRIALVAVTATLNIAHPILHGTPLDGGVLDAMLGTLNNHLATTADDED